MQHSFSDLGRNRGRYAGIEANPTRVVETHYVQVHVTLDTEVVQQQQRTLGWRVYVTNHPQPTLSLERAVITYRREYRIHMDSTHSPSLYSKVSSQ